MSSALTVLGCSGEESEVFWLLVAAVTNLGAVAGQLEDTGGCHAEPATLAKVYLHLHLHLDL